MPLKVREVIRMVVGRSSRRKGGHRQYKHAAKPGRVTISGNLGDDVKPGTLGSIKRQAGLK